MSAYSESLAVYILIDTPKHIFCGCIIVYSTGHFSAFSKNKLCLMQMYLYVAKLWIMIEQNDVRNCENWFTVVSLSSGDGYHLNRMTAGHVIRR